MFNAIFYIHKNTLIRFKLIFFNLNKKILGGFQPLSVPNRTYNSTQYFHEPEKSNPMLQRH